MTFEGLEGIGKRNVNPKVTAVAEKWIGYSEDNKSKACRMHKALYGSRQSGRQWYRKLDNELRLALRPLLADPCIHVLQIEIIVVLVVYVDDLIIPDDDHVYLTELKK